MYFIVYKTTNLISGKFYIGSHLCYSLNDGYLGSGKVLKLAIKKYGRENFKREIVANCVSIEIARNVEAQLVRYNVLKYGRFCYNRSINGTGAVLGTENSFYGKTHSEETKKKISDSAKKRTGEKNPFFGKKHSQESIDKINAKRPNSSNCIPMYLYSLSVSSGWWCTPEGCFTSAGYASTITGLSKYSLMQRCKHSDKVVNKNYQIPEKFWGKTWAENGYYLIEIKRGKYDKLA